MKDNPLILIYYLLILLTFSCTSKSSIDENYTENINKFKEAQKKIENEKLPIDVSYHFNSLSKSNSKIDSILKNKLHELIENNLVEEVHIQNKTTYHFLVKYYPSNFGTEYNHYISHYSKDNNHKKNTLLNQEITLKKELEKNWFYIITEQYIGY